MCKCSKYLDSEKYPFKICCDAKIVYVDMNQDNISKVIYIEHDGLGGTPTKSEIMDYIIVKINSMNLTKEAIDSETWIDFISNQFGYRYVYRLVDISKGAINITTDNLYEIEQFPIIFQRILSPNGKGITLKGREPSNYGNIGDGAFDFTKSYDTSGVMGATGDFSWGFGEDNKFTGYGSGGNGYKIINSGIYATAFGYVLELLGYASLGHGAFIHSSGHYEFSGGNGIHTNNYGGLAHGMGLYGSGVPALTVLGQGNVPINGVGNTNFNREDDPIFIIGNGKISQAPGKETVVIDPKDAFYVDKLGRVMAKSLTKAMIDGDYPKMVITKEYLEYSINKNKVDRYSIQLGRLRTSSYMSEWHSASSSYGFNQESMGTKYLVSSDEHPYMIIPPLLIAPYDCKIKKVDLFGRCSGNSVWEFVLVKDNKFDGNNGANATQLLFIGTEIPDGNYNTIFSDGIDGNIDPNIVINKGESIMFLWRRDTPKNLYSAIINIELIPV